MTDKFTGEGETMRDGENARAVGYQCEGCGAYVDPHPDTPEGRGHKVDNPDGSPGYCGPVTQRARENAEEWVDRYETIADARRFRWIIENCTQAAKLIDDQPPMIDDFEDWFREKIDKESGSLADSPGSGKNSSAGRQQGTEAGKDGEYGTAGDLKP